MKVIVVLPRALRPFAADQARVTLDLEEVATVGNALGALETLHPGVAHRTLDDRGEIRRHVNVFVDGENARDRGGLAASLHEGSEVFVLPAVSGGAVDAYRPSNEYRSTSSGVATGLRALDPFAQQREDHVVLDRPGQQEVAGDVEGLAGIVGREHAGHAVQSIRSIARDARDIGASRR